MATYNTLTDLLSAIANAIRSKTGETNTINAQNFPSKILSILQGSGNAQPSDVLTGKTFTNDSGEQTGTMANKGAWGTTINPGGSVTIPSGFHNGSGKVTANNGSNPAIKYNNSVSSTKQSTLSYTFDSNGKYRVLAAGTIKAYHSGLIEFYTNGSISSTYYSKTYSKGNGVYGGVAEGQERTIIVFFGDIVANSGNSVSVRSVEDMNCFFTLCVEKLSY